MDKPDMNKPGLNKPGLDEPDMRKPGMDKLLTCALAIAVCLGTTGMLASRHPSALFSQTANAPLAADAPFRDGLYVGELAARAGRPQHAPVGRWSNQADRARFAAGYRLGYHDSLAALAAGRTGQPE